MERRDRHAIQIVPDLLSDFPRRCIVRVRLVPSSVGASHRHQILATYLVNDTVAIDAGSLGLLSPLADQQRVKHVFLSHSHLDHVATLPVFVDNVYAPGPNCPTVWASPETLDSLQRDLFNDRLWPDMVRLSKEESPFLETRELADEQPVEVEGLRITPITLNHVVPTFGFLVEELVGGVAVLFVSDTAPSDRVWEIANQCAGLKGVLLEASFPNSYRWLADKAAHLTPDLFRLELQKLKRPVPFHAVHVKFAFETKVLTELQALNLPNLRLVEPNTTLDFV